MTLKFKLAIIGIMSVLLYGGHQYLVHEAVVQTKATMESSYNKALLKRIEQTRESEDKLKREYGKLLQDKDAKISNINARLLRAERMLSDRPNRSSNDSLNHVSTTSCTGRELFKEDGEFLAREAARADKLIIERDYYYQQYLLVYNILEEMRKNGQANPK